MHLELFLSRLKFTGLKNPMFSLLRVFTMSMAVKNHYFPP